MADPALLFDLAADVLAAVETYYVAQAVPLPERRYVSDGLVAFDCELLAVQVERVFGHEGNVAQEGIQALTAHVGFQLAGASVAVWLIRCAPMMSERGTPPTPAQIEASAQAVLGDPIRLRTALVAAQRAGQITGCNSLAFEAWEGHGPEGGMVGGLLRVRAGIGA